MTNMTKVRVYLALTIAAEATIFYLISLDVITAIPILLLTFIAMAFYMVPKAEERDLDDRLDSYRDRLPEILGALRAAESSLEKGSLGKKIKNTGRRLGFNNIDSFTEQEVEDLHGKVVARFREVARFRGEQLEDGMLNFITLHFFKTATSLGKEFLVSHLDYEIEKYKVDGLRETYGHSLDLDSGRISECEVRVIGNGEKIISTDKPEREAFAGAEEDKNLCIQGIRDAERQVEQGAGKVAAWSLDDSCRYLLAFAIKMKYKSEHERYMDEKISTLDMPLECSRMDAARLMKNIVSEVGVNGDVWFFAQSCIDDVLTEDSLDSFERLRDLLPIWRNEINRVCRAYRVVA